MNRIAGVVCGMLIAMLAGSASADLLLHYSFDELEGTLPDPLTVPDLSGRGNVGTLVNMDTMNLVPGVLGNALQFNGGSGDLTTRLELPSDHPDFNRSYTEFTFAAWLNSVDVAPDEPATTWILGKMGGGGNRGWQIGITGTSPASNPHELLFGYFDAPGGAEQEVFMKPNGSLMNDNWFHLAVVFRANDSVKFYINGDLALDNAGALSAMNGANNAVFQIGNRGNNQPNSWNGLMDEVYIFDHALTDAGVRALVPEPSSLTLVAFGAVLAIGAWHRGRFAARYK